MSKKFFFVIFILLFYSCSPKMHIVGAGMRKFNLSQNKYKPQKNEYNHRKPDQRN